MDKDIAGYNAEEEIADAVEEDIPIEDAKEEDSNLGFRRNSIFKLFHSKNFSVLLLPFCTEMNTILLP